MSPRATLQQGGERMGKWDDGSEGKRRMGTGTRRRKYSEREGGNGKGKEALYLPHKILDLPLLLHNISCNHFSFK